MGCWCWWGRRRRGGSTIQVGEGRQPLPTGQHLTPPGIRRWRGKKAERGGQRSTGGCLSLVGGCSLVAASPRSCATMTATTTRSWWRGWWCSCRQGRLPALQLNLVEDLHQLHQLVPHFDCRYLNP